MDQTLRKAMGVALLLHLLVGTAAQYLLPKGLDLAVPEPTAAPKPLPPIAIEFLPPGPEVPKIAPVAQPETEVLPAVTELAPNRNLRTPSMEDSSAQPPKAKSAEPSSGSQASPPDTGLGTRSPIPGSLSMRRAPGASSVTVPLLDPRLALGTAVSAPPGPRTGQERPDLLAAGLPRGEAPSAWRPSGGGTMRATGQPFHAEVKSDGRIEFRDKPNVQVESVTKVRFDITDAVMASLGETLYPYRKMKLMDESREVRSEMARSSKAQDLQQALKNYKKHLQWVWSHPKLSIAKRRRALFVLWDECAETGTEAVVASANSIRAMTLAFIRRRLPEGSEFAYTESELRDFNRQRRSTAPFTPY